MLGKQMSDPTGPSSDQTPRVVVLTCAVLELEIQHLARDMHGIVAIELLEQGLHNEPPKLRSRLQEAIARAEDQYPSADTIALGYGLCSRGVEGVSTTRCRLVIARAHDCITLLLGSKERYAEYVAQNPGTYWYSPGWNKHHVPPGPERHEKLYKAYKEKFGEEDAQFLMESEQGWFQTYDRATYVDQGIGPIDQDVEYTQSCAKWLNWKFDHQRGDPELLRALLAGPWDSERFLVLEPGQTPRMTADAQIVTAMRINGKPHQL
jgi:hypothetical protein